MVLLEINLRVLGRSIAVLSQSKSLEDEAVAGEIFIGDEP